MDAPPAAAAPAAAPAPAAVPRGLPKSSRTWKTPRLPFSRTGAPGARPVKGVKSGAFRAAMTNKASRNANRDITQRLRAELAAEKAAKREQRAERDRRRAENALRGTQFTAVTDSRKLKKMNKRQLMQLQKTATDKDGNTVLVPAFGKGSKTGGRGIQVSTFRKR